MRRPMTTLAQVGLVAAATTACTGLRHESTVNAPGRVVLAPPPFEDGSRDLYVEPDDPGEHELYLGPGVVAGPAAGRHDSHDAGAEVGIFLRVAYRERAQSHRHDELPMPGLGAYVLNLGWAPLQYSDHADIGPIHAELERGLAIYTVGLGVAVYPDDGNAGIQATVAAKPFGLRMRYMAETGFEVMGAFQIELPTAFTWSR